MEKPTRTQKKDPLPISFQILHGKTAKSPVCPVLTATLNNVQIVRTLDPEFLEPFISAGRLFEACNMTIIDGLVQFDLRLPFYDTDLGLGLFTDIWLPLNRCRRIAQRLGVFDQLANLLDWSSRKAYTLDDRTTNELVHNWRMQDIVDDKYSTREMLATSLKTPPQVLPGGLQIRTQINPEDHWEGNKKDTELKKLRNHLVLWSVRCYERHIHDEQVDEGEDYCDRYWETYQCILGLMSFICGASFSTTETFNEKACLIGEKEIDRHEAKEGSLLGQMVTAKVISQLAHGIEMIGIREEKFRILESGMTCNLTESVKEETVEGSPVKQTSMSPDVSKIPGVFPDMRIEDKVVDNAPKVGSKECKKESSMVLDSESAGPSSITVELLRRMDAITSKVSRIESTENVYSRQMRKVALLEKQNEKLTQRIETLEKRLRRERVMSATSRYRVETDIDIGILEDNDLNTEDDDTMYERTTRRKRVAVRRKPPAMKGNGLIGDVGEETNPQNFSDSDDDDLNSKNVRQKVSGLRRRRKVKTAEKEVGRGTGTFRWLPGNFWGSTIKDVNPERYARRNHSYASQPSKNIYGVKSPNDGEGLYTQNFPFTSIIIVILSVAWLIAFSFFGK